MFNKMKKFNNKSRYFTDELNKLGEEGKFEEITAVCEQYMAKLNEARGC